MGLEKAAVELGHVVVVVVVVAVVVVVVVAVAAAVVAAVVAVGAFDLVPVVAFVVVARSERPRSLPNRDPYSRIFHIWPYDSFLGYACRVEAARSC